MNKIIDWSRWAIISCVSVLFIALPFYTPLTTYLINTHNFPVWIVLWKEVLSVIILGLLFIDLIYYLASNRFQRLFCMWPIGLLGLITTYVLGLSLVQDIAIRTIVYGFRFELWWVCLLVVSAVWFRIVGRSWMRTNNLSSIILRYSIYAGLIISLVFGIAIYTTNQTTALENIGYGVYAGDAAYLNPVLCHPIDAFETSCRLSAGFTLPNHYAGYLLIVLGFVLQRLLGKQISKQERILDIILTAIIPIVIYLTASRFALLGLLIFAGWVFLITIIKYYEKIFELTPGWLIKLYIAGLLIIPALVGLVGINLGPEQLQALPTAIGKPSSTDEHYRRTMANVDIIKDNPVQASIGYGIGSSGPAAKQEYGEITDNPLHDPYIDLANEKWYVGYGIFVPENWYIQLLLNGGIVYALSYILLIGFPLWKVLFCIFRADEKDQILQLISKPRNLIYIGLYTIMVGNLFLHIWENQTLALAYALISLISD